MSHLIEGPTGLLNIAVDPRGARTPIIFVHSDGGNLHHWDEIRAHYNQERPTAAFDRRGHGKSDPPRNGAYKAVQSADDIEAVAEASGMSRFVLVGHSGGASAALAYSHGRPQTLIGLVLVDPPPDPASLPPGTIEKTIKEMDGPNYWPTIEGYYRSIAGDDPAVVDRVLADIKSTPKETVLALTKAGAHFRPGDFVGNFGGPALAIIQPEFDVDGAVHRIAGWPFESVAGAGHWIHLAARNQFLAKMDAFLASVNISAPSESQL